MRNNMGELEVPKKIGGKETELTGELTKGISLVPLFLFLSFSVDPKRL